MTSFTKTILGFLLLVCIVGTFPPTLASGDSWLTGWSDRQGITISNSTGAGTNYQVYLDVTYGSEMQADFDDLRFTAANGATELDYWIKEYIASTNASVWVEVSDNLNSTDVEIYMYSGNDGVSTTSNGYNTFIMFDDFVGGALNTTTWIEEDNAVTVSGGNLVLTGNTANKGTISAVLGYNINQAKHVKLKMDQTDSTNIRWMGMFDSWSVWDDIIDQYGSVTNTFCYTRVYDGGAVTGPTHQTCSNILTDWNDYVTTWTPSNVSFYSGSYLIKAFTSGNIPDGTSDLHNLFQEGNDGFDALVDWTFVRKFVTLEPVALFGVWNAVNIAEFFLNVGWNPAIQFGYDAFFIFLGLIMIPASTMYLVRGGRKDMSADKLFFGLIIFALGIGFLIGGIIP